MKVATILPTPLLREVYQTYNMCLYQVVKENPKYAVYFKCARERGSFVIMDNGAAEGVNPTIEELMEVYPLVEPNEIVLPDVVGDRVETIKRGKDAIAKLCKRDLDKKYQFMAVPQGANFGEWLTCLQQFLHHDCVTTIGVSKFTSDLFQQEMGADTNVRLELVDAILTEAKRFKKKIQIHLLGCWDNPKEIGEINHAFGDRVRGTDSGIAYVYTRNDVPIDGHTLRPDNDEIDFINGTVDDISLLQYNIGAWINLCNN